MHHDLVAGEHAVEGQREGAEVGALGHAREEVRRRAAVAVAALGADVVERSALGHIHFHDAVEARRARDRFREA
jgi:hypothetical protein